MTDKTQQDNHKLLEQILKGLMRRYMERVPNVEKILTAMIDQRIVKSADSIENDHIAFRTMGVPQLGIQSIEKIFLHCGYEKRDFYDFPEKKLNAFWYSPPADRFPRVFISELRVQELSPDARKIIRRYTDEVKIDPVLSLDLDDWRAVDAFLHSPLWSTPSREEYQALLSESEYAAWVIYNRYYLNHFTISIHSLPAPYNDIERFNEFLESLGVTLNDAGGKTKVSPDGLLLQSSTVAAMVEAEFRGGEKHKIAGSYVEFAERKVLPEFQHLPPDKIERKHRRDGFEAQNANRIFESTFTSQTEKHSAA